MTWSIIARDAASGAFGVAIATRFFAVGALCPHAESRVGALSTQALVNPHYGRQGLELLRAGIGAPEVVKRLIAPDEGGLTNYRQPIDERSIGAPPGGWLTGGQERPRGTAEPVLIDASATERTPVL